MHSYHGLVEDASSSECFSSARCELSLFSFFKLGVAVMKLKNPPVNTLSLEFLTELVICLEKLENDKSFRGVVLTSVGVSSAPYPSPSSLMGA